jgi:Concanavalin A-like lectin/glucanases superfamily
MMRKRETGVWICVKAASLILFLGNANLTAQTGQLDISRVQQMPNLPSPYLMRDWKEVAVKYDEFIFSTSKTGQYLPLIHLKPSGINYPLLQPILLDSYVGAASSGNQAEAINIMPSIIGATLNGIDKSNQSGINWVIKAKDLFNKANGQNVYLNGYSTTSGNDWWYDVMPNVYFYQLYSQYPTQLDFQDQFTTIADRWLQAVHAMGGSTAPWTLPQMNYRAWNLMSMTGNAIGVKEPESAGTIAWLLYHAYKKTNNKKYLDGAQMAMGYLTSLTSNPSYELQLPYGTFMAAKMNAELGTAYDIEKMLNWVFDKGPLRNWGTIVGTWNGSDVSGLIGEANDAGNDYAFVMNGFQQAAALVPLVKYDKRFAKAVAKWTLNVANASRFFYSQYIPDASQDNFAWSSANDPQSVIAYEALKENLSEKKLYATGDAVNGGWSQTNLSVYSSSSVGYLAALIQPTDVDGILLLDVNKTDFFGQNAFPSFLVYNPYDVDKPITLPLGGATYNIYDAISESIIKTDASGNTIINVKAGEVMMLVYLPQGSSPIEKNGKLLLENNVVDYHYGYHFDGKLRIKSLAVLDTLVEFTQQVPVYASIENPPGVITYNWYVNETLAFSSASENFTWSVPPVEGRYKILLEIISGFSSVKDSINLTVVKVLSVPPGITGFSTDKIWYATGSESSIVCNATGSQLQYGWTFPGGSIINQTDSLIHWSVPSTEGLYEISCEVTNGTGVKTNSSKQVLVRVLSTGVTPPFAYYPLDGNVLDFSGNGYDATVQGAQLTPDPRDELNKAYKFSLGTDIIFVASEASLNFQDALTVSFWVKLDAVTQESFIISHGSWEERWKVSVTPDKKLRWTIKTSAGTKDLDSTFPLALNQYYHFTTVYSSYSMELYANGVMDVFLAHTGLVPTTNKSLTFGRKDEATTNYFLRGSLDEVRIYDEALAPNEIETLMTLWHVDEVTSLPDEIGQAVLVYPNPANGMILISNINNSLRSVLLTDSMGKDISCSYSVSGDNILRVEYSQAVHGLMILRVTTEKEPTYFRVMAD